MTHAQYVQKMLEWGFYLFPLRGRGKEPLQKGWQEMSSNDFEVIMGWVNQGNNLGIDCGKSGLFVVDIDVKDGKPGKASWQALLNIHEAFTNTLVLRTWSGGCHVVYRGESCNSCGKLGEGLDVRSKGGYIVAPGSVINDHSYEVLSDVPIVAVPKCLVELNGQPKDKDPLRHVPAIPVDMIDDEKLIDTAIHYLENEAPEAVEGCGGDAATYQVACKVRDLGISEEKCSELMAEYYNNTKCFPPWDLITEPGTRTGNSLRDKVANAYRYAGGQMGNKAMSATASLAFGCGVGNTVVQPFTPANSESNFQVMLKPLAIEHKDAADIQLSEERHKRRWILGWRYIRKFATAIIAPGGVGKSTLSIVDALAICSGRELIGEKVHETGTVWIHNAEDPLEEIELRVAAAMQYHKIQLSSGELILTSGRDLDIRLVLKDPAGGVVRNEPAIKAIIQKISELEIVLWLIDPLVRMHRASENDNDEMDEVMRVLQHIAEETGCAIGVIHHTRKLNGAQGAGDAESARGASSVISAARFVFTLTTMTKEDAKHFPHIQEKERRWYTQLLDAKVNMAPPMDQQVWLKKQDVQTSIGEHVGTMIPADLVPVTVVNPAKVRGMEERALIVELAAKFCTLEESMSMNQVAAMIAGDSTWMERFGTAQGSVYAHMQKLSDTSPLHELEDGMFLYFFHDPKQFTHMKGMSLSNGVLLTRTKPAMSGQ